MYYPIYADNCQNILPGEVEFPFLVALEHPETGERLELPLKGYIDFREADGTVHELKTAAKLAVEAEISNHLQLTGYAYACWKSTGAIPGLKLVQLIKTKKPRLVFWETRRTEKDLCRFYRLTERVLAGIKAGIFYPNPSYGKCYCEYEGQFQGWEG